MVRVKPDKKGEEKVRRNSSEFVERLRADKKPKINPKKAKKVREGLTRQAGNYAKSIEEVEKQRG